MKLLTIICPALTWRSRDWGILHEISFQIGKAKDIELLWFADNAAMSIGEKMNLLMDMAGGEYICGVGDDDGVSTDYIESLREALSPRDVDCVSFDHNYYQNGEFCSVIREALGQPWTGQAPLMLRPVSTKCPIRTDIARPFRYPPRSIAEDRDFATWVQPQLKSERRINRVLYDYRYKPDKWDGKPLQRELGRAY